MDAAAPDSELTTPRVIELRSGTGPGWRLFASIAACGIFVAAGVAMGVSGDPAGWLIALLFAAFLGLGIVGVRGVRAKLTIQENWFTVSGFGTHLYRWSEVEGFAPSVLFGGHSVVEFKLTEAGFMRRSGIARVLSSSRRRTIPARGTDAGELAQLLNRYRLAAPLTPEEQEEQAIEIVLQTRFPFAVWAIVAANVAIFVWQVVSAGSIEPTSGRVFEDGALYGPLVELGDWWRAGSYSFLHLDPIHLMTNMFILVWVGREVERLIGSVRFAGLYFVSVVAGAAGALLIDGDLIILGASGGVLGVLAAGVVADSRGAMSSQGVALVLLGVNAVYSFTAGVSLGAHLGGVIGGLAAMLVLTVRDPKRGIAFRPVGPALAGLAAVLVAACLAVWFAAERTV